jgi:ABC-2 type transport system permease protein
VALLASQVAFRLSLATVQTLLILAAGIVVFDVNIVGSPLALAGFVLLGTLAFLALGYLIASLARTQDSANGLTQVLYLPMMLLSGLFFPVSLMPTWIRPVTHALPLSYLADALRQTMVGATPTYSLGLDVAVLAGWLAVCSLLAVRFFKWD